MPRNRHWLWSCHGRPLPLRNASATLGSSIQKLANTLKVIVWEGYQVKAIAGNGFANRVILDTAQGREVAVDVDGIFVELGLVPNSELVRELAELDGEGFVVVDSLNRTTCTGLFAAGDVTNAFTEQV